MEEQIKYIELVLSGLRHITLYGELSRSGFGEQEIQYLGSILNARKISIIPNKTDKFIAWRTVWFRNEMQFFL